jgi:hypothetical protein
MKTGQAISLLHILSGPCHSSKQNSIIVKKLLKACQDNVNKTRGQYFNFQSMFVPRKESQTHKA